MFRSRQGEWRGAGKGIRDVLSSNVPPKKKEGKNKKGKKKRKGIGKSRWVSGWVSGWVGGLLDGYV